MSNRMIRFLTEELMPQVEKTHTLSQDRKMRASAGRSSGGPGAFTAAWHSDYFHKVMSHNGSFTNIIRNHEYPFIIRKSYKKDIKMYLLASRYDLDNEHGNWFISNLQMASSLKYQGYEYRMDEADDEHNSTHGGAFLPDTLTWLWSDVIDH